jgi:hypothetical protein
MSPRSNRRLDVGLQFQIHSVSDLKHAFTAVFVNKMFHTQTNSLQMLFEQGLHELSFF